MLIDKLLKYCFNGGDWKIINSVLELVFQHTHANVRNTKFFLSKIPMVPYT